MKTRYLCYLVKPGVVLFLFLASFSALGPRHILNDRFDYNESISRAVVVSASRESTRNNDSQMLGLPNQPTQLAS